MAIPSRRKRTDSPKRQQLQAIRHALLDLHKVLIDTQREQYEKTVGPISSPNHFLKLLTEDPWFAWLHPFSQLIVAIDEALDEKEPLTEAMMDALIDKSRSLLVAQENNEGVAGHYYEALQQDPDVVLAHATTIKLIGRKKTP